MFSRILASIHSSYREQVKDPARVSKAPENGLGNCGAWTQGLRNRKQNFVESQTV